MPPDDPTTDPTLPPGTHTHLDDEVLSSFVDEFREVVDGCERCTDRLVALTRAARQMAVPVPPLAPDVADRLVATALAALDAPVVALRRRRVTTPPATWLVAAAAIFALVLGVPALMQRAERSGESAQVTDTAAGQAEALSAAPPAGGSGQAADTDAASPAQVAGGTAAAGAPGDGSFSFSDDGFGTDGLGEVGDPDELVRRLIAVLSTRDSDRAQDAGRVEEKADAVTPCETEARAIGAGRLGGLTYRATVVWQGAEATVLVFQLQEPSGGDTRQAYVMSAPACSLLADPRF